MDNRDVPNPGDAVKIPLKERMAREGLRKVKPTSGMPRPGSHPTKPKRKAKARFR